ncbi:M18 family aminopeptidase [Clostridium sp.]|uniref:M18 family aminopeptidase n=1 Tax=Clostridium sp. TaxID=1506 RepID=UPI002FC693F3
MDKLKLAHNLIDFIDNSPSQFHATNSVVENLLDNGFKELKYTDKWNIEKGGKYFVTKNDSAVIAFEVGSGNIEDEGFKIISSHTDSPGFRIKPDPYMKSNGYIKLNTEVYGGPILNTWMDRPLSIAGKVTIKSDNILKPITKIIDLEDPIIIIPNVAIHHNKNVNQGIELNKQIDMIPLLGIINDNINCDNYLAVEIAKRLDINATDILDYDLFIYGVEKGSIIGFNKEFISSSRLDNLSMVHSSLVALTSSAKCSATKVIACFDNEEIGSSTKQGGDSRLLSNTLERIMLSLGKGREEFLMAVNNSFMISADLAHAIHPNRPEKHDPVLQPMMNKGPVIKIAASGSYTSDSYSSGVYESICKKANVPCQKYCNRSDARGGSTLGPISSTHLEMDIVDIGSPILSMHSIKELAGVDDHLYTTKSLIEFFNI